MNPFSSQLVKDAASVWKVMNGVFSIYKPPGLHFEQMKETIMRNICRDLNQLKPYERQKYVDIKGSTQTKMSVVVRDSYADHPLIAGPQYVLEDLKFTYANKLSQESSGVIVCGINHGSQIIQQLREARLTKFYKIRGILGQARIGNFATGKLTHKATWKRIRRHGIDAVCAYMQADHQKKMFQMAGVDIRTQEAYDLATQGIIRTGDAKIPMIYSIKCVDFQPPEFTLEMVCLTEDDDYLKSIVAELGYKLHSFAHCSYMQCTQFGLFNVRDALLTKNWNLQEILDSMSLNRQLLLENPHMLDPHDPKNAHLQLKSDANNNA
ncbi:mitochondrial mRNA pseudouridine synthase Trub2 [Trichogramma pretiosum]|uniref:mitochondrial mRNA pseudouridine synthase Trub2 n=1 Tax=Trichogramma pretiosum TaxID=7493 RepID=UPI0006C9A3B5|nr:mitochondrial mRNA pseudouridine synthase Trub2 [Trichogramma pretiosum]